jgi:hypothetical protein
MRRRLGLAALAGVALAGCTFGADDAHFTDMVPGEKGGTSGYLDCWIGFQLDALPEGVDSRELSVTFTSAALEEDLEFDWAFIAAHDVEKRQNGGRGWIEIADTTADGEPPLGRELNVRFPLALREQFQPDGKIWLEATLWWGGEPQDTIKRSLEHLYARVPGS